MFPHRLLSPVSRLLFSVGLAVVATVRAPAATPPTAPAAPAAPVVSRVEPPAAPTDTFVHYLSGHGIDDAVAWDFSISAGRRAGEWTKIPVPSNWELHGFGTYAYGRGTPADRNPPTEKGQYRFDFTVPAAWQGRVVRIVFDGAMTDTEVLINGQSAGPVHQGAFYRFRYDITNLLKFGASNRLEVTVSKESANASVNNAERRGDYWNFGGIFRPVWLEALPASFIERTAINARADGSFAADVFLGAGVSAGRITGQLFDAADKPVGPSFAATIAAGAEKVVLQTKLDRPALWTAETPNLYRVRYTLASASGSAAHTVTERFGFRTFEVRKGDGLYLNGQKIVLKGADRHSFWPESGRALSAKICYDDVRLMKDANMNAVRMSHYPPDHEFLDACDELGLYVLDELAGWHQSYDTPTGARLIGEMVRRDVNHPSILFWDNGNEGGWNRANDGEFAKWDPQARAVLHPWELNSNVNTKHYPTYAEMQKLCAGPDIVMPTEFMHGLYDGGGGSGLRDYWEVMRANPRLGGGFIWALVDEAVVRTDENGRLDAVGNLAPDGITGPHREKEGSYFTIKEIWSPVQVTKDERTFASGDEWNTSPQPLGTTAPGVIAFPHFAVRNDYDFTNLNQCRFEWEFLRFGTTQAERVVLAKGEMVGPDVAPHATGSLSPASAQLWHQGVANVFHLTVRDPAGRELWTWSFPIVVNDLLPIFIGSGSPVGREEGGQLIIAEGRAPELRFDKATGLLVSVSRSGQKYPLGAGPRFIAQELANRGAMRVGTPSNYRDLAGASTLTGLTAWKLESGMVVVQANYSGPLQQVTWRITPGGEVRLDYSYTFDGTVDILGVSFDCDESAVKGATWLGWGPYRTWQNRIEGTTFDVWHTVRNNPIPGERWEYPEFQGYFRGWRWATLDTTAGPMVIASGMAEKDKTYLGLFTPHDGKVGPLLKLPTTGLAFLDVIPAMRDKFKVQSQLGPQSEPQKVSGVREGHVTFRFDRPPAP